VAITTGIDKAAAVAHHDCNLNNLHAMLALRTKDKTKGAAGWLTAAAGGGFPGNRQKNNRDRPAAQPSLE
jgi:hypothetical protein